MNYKKQISEPREIEEFLEAIFITLDSEIRDEFSDNGFKGNDQSPASITRSVEIIYEAKTLKEYEVSLLERATNMRESGLILLRKNKIEEGDMALREAKQIVNEKKICKEARLIVLTYQSAAESFYYMKMKDYDEALRLMKTAIIAHEDLFGAYGHPIEQRRIHLAGNIAKIFIQSRKYVTAFKLLTQLIEYIFIDDRTWPLDYGKIENPDKIPVEIRMHVVNQLLKSMGRILQGSRNEEIISSFTNLITKLEQSKHSEAMTIFSWCKAIRAVLKNDKITFLKNALYFLQHEKLLLPSARDFILTSLKNNFNMPENMNFQKATIAV